MPPSSDALLQVWTYAPPIIIATGIIGNILSFIAVTNKNCKKSSFTVYLAALAVYDTLFLLSFLFTMWLKYIFGIDVEILGGAMMCRVYSFCSYLFPTMSTWLIVCLTLERWFCTAFPHKIQVVNRPRTAVIIIIVITAFQVMLHAHVLIRIDYFSDDNTTACNFTTTEYEHFVFYYWGWIVISNYYFLPVLIIIIANTLTVLQVYKSSRSVASTMSDAIRRRNRYIKMTTLLVSTAFILLAAPQALLLTIRPFLFDDLTYFVPNSEPEQIFEAVGYIAMSLNHSINFFLYCLSGNRFRKDLKAAFSVCDCPLSHFMNVHERNSVPSASTEPIFLSRGSGTMH